MAATFNEMRRAGTIQAALKNALGMTDQEPGLIRVSESLVAVKDLWSRPEWAFLRQEKLFAIRATVAANVAGISRFQLSNPAGSNIIAVIDELDVTEQTALASYILTDNGAFIAGGLAPLSARDTRWDIAVGGGSRPTNTLQTVDNAAAATSGIVLDSIVVPLNNPPARFFCGVPFILTPGQWIQVQSGTVNHQATFTARGYERVAFPGEIF